MEPTSHHSVVCFGEVLWDILPYGHLPGGAPMNVAYHLKKLGIDPALVTKIGLDSFGEKLVNILSASGISTEFFFVDYDHATGLVYANANDQNEVVYDIVNPSAWDFIEFKDELTTLVSNADYFIYGSLTSRNSVSRNTLNQLLQVAKTKVLDINLRAPHYHRVTIESLLSTCDILKMNIGELELITGWFSHFHTTEERIKEVQEKFNIPTLIVTMGGDGAMVSHAGKIYRQDAIKVDVTDTIGSGDSFLAGFLSQLMNGATVQQALEFATAIGAFIATKSGACPEYDINEVRALINSSAKIS